MCFLIQPARLHLRPAASLWWASALIVMTVGGAGCAPYQFGNAGLFPSGIRTVHVPSVRNETFRHELGPQLHEALVREIEMRTPYKVTDSSVADSTLVCTIQSEIKHVLTETDSDDPRALDAAVVVNANWIGRGGVALMQDSVIPEKLSGITFSSDSRMVPEAGQSIDTTNLENVEFIASRIVSQMESRW
ncbi:LPS assembly lipoprotein LptE [Crateriforma conspicua]|uniref:Lipopolysaccharide-assembly n=1 Tax=Crateriforma conspicua TaxID=2527996 RepID=A0A5C5Y7T8_9PLAN|nr:LPS assembly lipoprotein LptE [Crateriforma conspicua]TWT71244.1 hypothetical protein Pan14r_35540 [Crateriforma conspicua]